MEGNIMEMSTLDKHLPKYYKGFDMDILLKKMRNNEVLSEEEGHAIDEAQAIYYEEYLKKGRNKWEKWKKEHPGEYRTHIDCSMIKR